MSILHHVCQIFNFCEGPASSLAFFTEGDLAGFTIRPGGHESCDLSTAIIKLQGVKRLRNCVPKYSILTEITALKENIPKIIPSRKNVGFRIWDFGGQSLSRLHYQNACMEMQHLTINQRNRHLKIVQVSEYFKGNRASSCLRAQKPDLGSLPDKRAKSKSEIENPNCVDLLGLEPRITEPKSAVLPITP